MKKMFFLFFFCFAVSLHANPTCPTSMTSFTFSSGQKLDFTALPDATKEALLSELMQRGVTVRLHYRQHGLGKIYTSGPIRNITHQKGFVAIHNVPNPQFALSLDQILEVEVEFANASDSLTLAINGLASAGAPAAKPLYPPRAPVFVDDPDGVVLDKMTGDSDVEVEAVKKARLEARTIVADLLQSGNKAALVKLAGMNVMQEQIPEFFYIAGGSRQALLMAIQRADEGDLARLNRIMGADYPHVAKK